MRSLLSPYNPPKDGPWGRAQAGHLLRRAGFAPSADEIEATLRAGIEATVARLVADSEDPSPRFRELDEAGEALAAGGSIEKLAGWWLMRMVHTGRPLHARVTLLWHNHFATSNVKVGAPPLMLRQLRTLERGALGRFEELLLGVSRDPAMIVWLDGVSNRKGKPNENYARELFELFALGPGNYSEHDIREAARAFSGWHEKDGRFHFNERLHDFEAKSVFGQAGDFDGGDVVRLCLAHEACAPFLARRLLREFVRENPGPELIGEVAAVLRASDYDLSATLQTLLRSRAFFDPRHYRVRIKSPVEFVVGLARSLEMKAPGQKLRDATAQMGQRLFEPPSVKGWDGHRRWINSANMLVRMNVATAAAAGGEQGLDAAECARRQRLESAAAAVAFACDVMLGGDAPPAMRAALEENCTGSAEAALRAAVAAIGASPEYQLA